jgi:hypothetical protein
MSANRPAAADVRAGVLDPLRMTHEQSRQLRGQTCARCARTDALTPGGMAYMASGPDRAGRLGFPVMVCPDHTGTGGTW